MSKVFRVIILKGLFCHWKSPVGFAIGSPVERAYFSVHAWDLPDRRGGMATCRKSHGLVGDRRIGEVAGRAVRPGSPPPPPRPPTARSMASRSGRHSFGILSALSGRRVCPLTTHAPTDYTWAVRGEARFLMSCLCGHGPGHHYGHSTRPSIRRTRRRSTEPPGGVYCRPRRRRPDADELADYLQELGEQIGQVRRDLEKIRTTGPSTKGAREGSRHSSLTTFERPIHSGHLSGRSFGRPRYPRMGNGPSPGSGLATSCRVTGCSCASSIEFTVGGIPVQSISLREVDGVHVTTLMDNSSDVLLPDEGGLVRRWGLNGPPGRYPSSRMAWLSTGTASTSSAPNTDSPHLSNPRSTAAPGGCCSTPASPRTG